MKVITNPIIVGIDVEQTLIDWYFDPKTTSKKDLIEIGGMKCKPILECIHELKLCKARGFYVIVWSAAGAELASEVVWTLGLDKYVDVVMAKPKFMIDDKTPNDWTSVYHPLLEHSAYNVLRDNNHSNSTDKS